jgi:hypothetical protein
MTADGKEFPMADKRLCVAIDATHAQADEAFSRL